MLEAIKALIKRTWAGDPPVRQVRRCDVFYKGDSLLVTTVHTAASRTMSPGRPFEHFVRRTDAATLGRAVAMCIRGSQSGLSDDESSAHIKSVLIAAGERSWEDLERRWQLVTACIQPGRDHVEVWRSRRWKGGGHVTFEEDLVGRVDVEDENLLGRLVLCAVAGETKPNESIEDGKRLNPAKSATSPPAELGLTVGARVVDCFGKVGVVTFIDAASDHGLGRVEVHYDDGRIRTVSLVASGLTPV